MPETETPTKTPHETALAEKQGALFKAMESLMAEIATEEPRGYPYWFESLFESKCDWPEGLYDSVFEGINDPEGYFCWDCMQPMLAKLPNLDSDGNELWHYAGGQEWGSNESDGPDFCEKCGKLLEYTLLDPRDELKAFEDNPDIDTAREVAEFVELLECVDGMNWELSGEKLAEYEALEARCLAFGMRYLTMRALAASSAPEEIVPGVTRHPGVFDGAPCVAGTMIRTSRVADIEHRPGFDLTTEPLVFGLTEPQITLAVAFESAVDSLESPRHSYPDLTYVQNIMEHRGKLAFIEWLSKAMGWGRP